MLALAALGLLHAEPLHGYRLKQQLEIFMSGCISVNYGAIYPLLKRLETQGAIEVDATAGASRKIYSLTEKGKQLWQQKMLEHPHESWVHARSRFTIKFFFFAYLEPQERLKLLEYRLMACRMRLEQKDRDRDLLPLDPYQAAIWERFSQILEQDIQWLEEQIAREKAELTPLLSLTHQSENPYTDGETGRESDRLKLRTPNS